MPLQTSPALAGARGPQAPERSSFSICSEGMSPSKPPRLRRGLGAAGPRKKLFFDLLGGDEPLQTSPFLRGQGETYVGRTLL